MNFGRWIVFTGKLSAALILFIVYFLTTVACFGPVDIATHTIILEYIEFIPKEELIAGLVCLAFYIFYAILYVKLLKNGRYKKAIISILIFLQLIFLFGNLVNLMIKNEIAFEEIVLLVEITTIINFIFLFILILFLVKSFKVRKKV